MHTARELSDATFAVTIDGAPASVADLFPGFDASDRVGVVVGSPHGLVGASLLVLAAVHRFYDLQRQGGDDFWIYPDFFAFHVGRAHGHHGAVDIWPSHKEVVVDPDGTDLLRAINDRGITRLAVDETASSPGSLEAEALASARWRLRTAFAYSSDGRTADPDVEIAGDDVTDGYVDSILDPASLIERLGTSHHAAAVRAHLDEVPQELRDDIASRRRSLRREGRTVESYRRIEIDEALSRLLPTAA